MSGSLFLFRFAAIPSRYPSILLFRSGKPFLQAFDLSSKPVQFVEDPVALFVDMTTGQEKEQKGCPDEKDEKEEGKVGDEFHSLSKLEGPSASKVRRIGGTKDPFGSLYGLKAIAWAF